MLRLLAGLITGLFLATSAFAQSGVSVKQSGSSVTPNTIPYWVANGMIGDSVTAADSPVTSFGVTSSGSNGNCVNSARQSTGGWNSLCLGYIAGVPTISVAANGSATTQPLQFVVNGTTYSFPGVLNSIILNSTPVTGGAINGDCLNITSGAVGQVSCSILSAGTTGTGAVVLQNSPTLAGTVGGNLTFNGNELFSGNVSMGSQLIVNGVSTPASASNQTVIMGNITAPTLTNTGQAWLFGEGTGGATLQGDGSSFDISLLNKNGTPVMQVPTGATGITFPGVLTLSGLSSGSCAASVLLDASNHTITGSCPGAAASIEVGTTTVLTGTTNNILYDNAGTLGNNTIASFLTGGTGISVTGTTNATIATNLTGGTGITLSGSAPQSIGLSTITGPGVLGATGSGAGQTVTTVSAPVLLNTLTASGSATLGDTTSLTSAYSMYEIVFEDILPATNNVTCQIQVHSGGVFQATNYQFAIGGPGSSTGAYTGAGSGAATAFPCSYSTQALNSAQTINGFVRITNPSVSSIHTVFGTLFASGTSGSPGALTIGGFWNSSAVIDGFQVLMSSGNISSGKIRIWGYP